MRRSDGEILDCVPPGLTGMFLVRQHADAFKLAQRTAASLLPLLIIPPSGADVHSHRQTPETGLSRPVTTSQDIYFGFFFYSLFFPSFLEPASVISRERIKPHCDI